jgi:hypothetical protein
LLHTVAAKETLIKNNPVLEAAMKEIHGFEARAEGLGLAQFDAFRTALEQTFDRLVD